MAMLSAPEDESTARRRRSQVTQIIVPNHLIHKVNPGTRLQSISQAGKRQQSFTPTRQGCSEDGQHRSVADAIHAPASRTQINPSMEAHAALAQKPSYVSTFGAQDIHSADISPQIATLSLQVPAQARKQSTVTFSVPSPLQHKGHLPRNGSIYQARQASGNVTHSQGNTKISTPAAIAPKSSLKMLLSTESGANLPLQVEQDYFGDYDMHGKHPEVSVQSMSPLEATSTDNEMNGEKLTGWRWGGPKISSRKSSLDPSDLHRGTVTSTTSKSESRRGTIWQRTASVWQDALQNMAGGIQSLRRGTVQSLYDKAKKHRASLQRSAWTMILFEYVLYLLFLALIYFVFVGLPFWRGTAYWLWFFLSHEHVSRDTWSVALIVAILFAYAPLCVRFEPDAELPREDAETGFIMRPGVEDTCLIIPCYKSAAIIGPTLQAAAKIFPPSHIFVIANGNNVEPLDDTAEICEQYGVNHIWSTIGSKIIAQFVGCYAAAGFKHALLIDDDCLLPANFPVVTDRMTKNVQCVGYSIKSVGTGSSKGTWAQQAQDLEYKLAGLQRVLASKVGSVMFPHGAISLWNREFLIRTFHQHPGFDVSEDWFFGHVARELGCRTIMCTSVFIETETPSSVFLNSGSSRGGFGEMTVFQQRFRRWNFFFVNGMWYNMSYILWSWRLGFLRELATKIFCLQEVLETLLYLATPLVLPISFYIKPLTCLIVVLIAYVAYLINAAIFNEYHLRRKNERVASKVVYFYYMPYKFVLAFVNVASCYYALFKYATYFARRHLKVVEDERALGMVLQLEETMLEKSTLCSSSRSTVSGKSTELDSKSVCGPRAASMVAPDESAAPRKAQGHLRPPNLHVVADDDLVRSESVVSPFTRTFPR